MNSSVEAIIHWWQIRVLVYDIDANDIEFLKREQKYYVESLVKEKFAYPAKS